jgi:transcription antitermination factor NusG
MTESIGYEPAAAEHPPLPGAGRWFVLHTRSRQEKIVAADLAALGIGFFFPAVHQPRMYGRRKTAVLLPMFPGYLFLRGDTDQVYQADRTRRIASVIPVPDQRRLDWELRNIHFAMTRGLTLGAAPFLEEGTAVEVVAGPLKGLQGVIEKQARPDRLVLQVQMLGRGMSVEVDPAQLVPI